MIDSLLETTVFLPDRDGGERINAGGGWKPAGSPSRYTPRRMPSRRVILPISGHYTISSGDFPLPQCIDPLKPIWSPSEAVISPWNRAPTTYPLCIRICPPISTGERGRWPETSRVKPLPQWLDWLTFSLTKNHVRVTRTGVRLRGGAKTLSTKTTNTTRVFRSRSPSSRLACELFAFWTFAFFVFGLSMASINVGALESSGWPRHLFFFGGAAKVSHSRGNVSLSAFFSSSSEVLNG